MNLDSLSLALSQISCLVANLTKKNYKQTSAELNNVCCVANILLKDAVVLLHGPCTILYNCSCVKLSEELVLAILNNKFVMRFPVN